MNRSGIISVLLTSGAMLVLVWVSGTLPSVIIFIPLLFISLLISLWKTDFPPKDPTLTLYLLAIGLQLLHFAEEFNTDFVVRLPALINNPPYPIRNWVIFNLAADAIFILGAVALHKQIKALMFITYFFVLAAVALNSVAHILLSFYVGGYFPGLITAIAYLPLAFMLLPKMLDLNR